MQHAELDVAEIDIAAAAGNAARAGIQFQTGNLGDIIGALGR
jgi:hypothetical protein